MPDMHVTGEGKLTLEGKLIWSDGSHEPVDLGVLSSSEPEVQIPAPPVLSEGDTLIVTVTES
jgi:hypothetical protein